MNEIHKHQPVHTQTIVGIDQLYILPTTTFQPPNCTNTKDSTPYKELFRTRNNDFIRKNKIHVHCFHSPQAKYIIIRTDT